MGYLEADGADRRQAIEQPRHPRQTYGGRPGRRHRCALDARCLITAATRILLEMMMGNRNRMPADFAGSSPPASRPPPRHAALLPVAKTVFTSPLAGRSVGAPAQTGGCPLRRRPAVTKDTRGMGEISGPAADGAGRRPRRELLAGAAAVAGVIAAETLASTTPAQATQGSAVLLGQDNTGATARTGLFDTGSESAVLADPVTHIGVAGTGGANGSGVQGIGAGSGSGVLGSGGASAGAGVTGFGAGGGPGVSGTGDGFGAGVVGNGGTGTTGAHGVEGFGRGTGSGLVGTSGANSGAGVVGSGQGNAARVLGIGAGSGAGVTGSGGASGGAGVAGSGGSGGGDGVLGTV